MGDRSDKHRCDVAVGPDFQAHVNDAISRFSYLHPSIEIEVGPEVISLFADSRHDVGDLVRDLQFALYRQKIYAETLPLRKTLIEGVMGR
ncbi:hypothetical protein VPK21_004352 [Sinorhizobium kummerowiae]|uniref:Uncharacterized protein n=1 Tax=Sinorhizobium kummerowiae TaxID=158892 RepID=A0ABY8T8J5_9HYPH|nr:hypothetical protein [Sinorhizobium kummerowiae]WHS94231.1 hypothetical protein PZL22_001936 [Sinorhizobium kummerowiae]WRW46159.1 hypothetical protein VPK21_004352 [Sinorhizobium kummerowiae]